MVSLGCAGTVGEAAGHQVESEERLPASERGGLLIQPQRPKVATDVVFGTYHLTTVSLPLYLVYLFYRTVINNVSKIL